MTANYFSGRRVGAAFLAVILMSGNDTGFSAETNKMIYPITATTNQVDDYHGIKIADPYRWLEDDQSAATKAWVARENKLTFGYLDTIPQRPAIRKRLTELWNYERYGIPEQRGGCYFMTRNDGLQNQAVLYKLASLSADPEVLLDPNKLSTNGTVSLAGYSISDDGSLLAYGLAKAGSDWQEWKVRNIETGKDLTDTVEWVKFSGASWRKDGEGFFYSRFDAPKTGESLKGLNQFHKLYYHRLGTAQSNDQLIYERPDHPDWNFNGNVTDDGRYLIIHVSQGTDWRNRIFYQDLQHPESQVVELLNDFEADYDFIDNVGTLFYFRTGRNAPLKRVIAIDILNSDKSWQEIIPQAPEKLDSVSLVNDELIVTYLKDAHSVVKIFSRSGKLVREVAQPGLGTVNGFGGKRGDTETFYQFTSFTQPGTIYRYDLKTGESRILRAANVAFNSSLYETKQVFYPSKDGTRVPMFITAKRGLKLDGNNPVYLYAYGGFDISLTPAFSPSIIAWLELGGVFVEANLRGGGEYGEAWHEAGMKAKKQNVFDDFIAAAEWLIKNNYTRKERLAIAGGSNGGLLVGACLTQRPDLFGAALPAVGVMDMLRFNKFTIGWAWQSEYGSPEAADDFAVLRAYSPLHNIRPGTDYPATFITTGDHDDRVVPAHSFKFAAALQAAQGGSAPILIRIETQAGHGAGKPTSKLIEESADKWSFLVKQFGMNGPEVKP